MKPQLIVTKNAFLYPDIQDARDYIPHYKNVWYIDLCQERGGDYLLAITKTDCTIGYLPFSKEVAEKMISGIGVVLEKVPVPIHLTLHPSQKFYEATQRFDFNQVHFLKSCGKPEPALYTDEEIAAAKAKAEAEAKSKPKNKKAAS